MKNRRAPDRNVIVSKKGVLSLQEMALPLHSLPLPEQICEPVDSRTKGRCVVRLCKLPAALMNDLNPLHPQSIPELCCIGASAALCVGH